MSSYLEHLAERKEIAFKRWMESGYRDLTAHDEFVRHYEECNRVHHIIRLRKPGWLAYAIGGSYD